MTRIIVGTFLTLWLSCSAQAQGTAASPTFEVASVKLAPPPDGSFQVGCNGGPGTPDPGLFTCFNTNIPQLLALAYNLKPYQIPSSAGTMAFGPGDTSRFNISAKVPPDTTKEQFKLMLQSLLVERFKLASHFEKKEMQVYELVIAKGGLKMKESPPAAKVEADAPAPPTPPPARKMSLGADGFPEMPPVRAGRSSMTIMRNGRARWVGSEITMEQIVDMLASHLVRPVTDATGLKGKYDLNLIWVAENNAVAIAPDTDTGPSVFTAIQEQLGLRLEQKKGAVDLFVIDHVEKSPTEN